MRLVPIAAAAALIAVPALAAPGDVNAHKFYTEARQLMSAGMGAVLDPRAITMAGQLKDASARVKSENAAATARGKPLYCVPEAMRGTRASPQMILDKLGSIPERHRRKLTLAKAWRAVMIRDYPCR